MPVILIYSLGFVINKASHQYEKGDAGNPLNCLEDWHPLDCLPSA